MLNLLGHLLGDYKLKDAKASYLGDLMLFPDELKSEGKLSISGPTDLSITSKSIHQLQPAAQEPPPSSLEHPASSIDSRIPNPQLTAFLLHYNFDLSFNKKMFFIRKLNSALTKGDKKLVTVKLDKSFTHYYAQSRVQPPETSSVIDVNINDLELKSLNGVMGEKLQFFSGTLNSKLALSLRPDNDFFLQGSTSIKNLLLDVGKKINEVERPVDINMENKIGFNIDLSNRFHVNNFEFTLQLPKDKSTEGVAFILTEPFSFIFDKNRLVVGNNIKFNASGEKIHIKDFLKDISVGSLLKVNDGDLRYNLNFDIPKDLNSLKVNGHTKLLYLDICLFGKTIKNLSISNTLNAEFCDTDTIKLKNSALELYVNGVRGLLAKTDGILVFDKMKDSNLRISVENITKFLPNFLNPGVSDNIKNLQGKGKIYFDYNKQKRNISLNGKLNFFGTIFKGGAPKEKDSKIVGAMDFKVNETKKKFNLKKLNISLIKDDKNILKLNTLGEFPVPLKSGTSNLSVTSDRLALGEVVDLYNVLKGRDKQSSFLPLKEYDPIDFGGLDLKCKIVLDNVTYGKINKIKDQE